MEGLTGRVALITGAASGIGKACAQALAGAGAQVVLADIDTGGAQEAVSEIERAGGSARALALDVASERDWQSATALLRALEGSLHILVNNAGLCIASPVADMSLASWRRQLAVNLDGVFLGTRACLPLMAESGGGSIVNISSVAGLKGVPGLAGYCATKGGVRLFTKAVALECAQARNHIRVNSVHPGAIETPIWAKMANDGNLPPAESNSVARLMAEAQQAAEAATPLGMAGSPSDIAGAVLYLCTDAARFVTGAELVVDGGVWAG